MDTTPDNTAPGEVAMKDATLNDVLWIAYRNASFLKVLLVKPEAALASAKLQLTPADLKALKTMLRQKFVVDGKHVLSVVNQILVAAGMGISTTDVPKPPTPPPPPPPPPWRPEPPLMPIPPIQIVKPAAKKRAKGKVKKARKAKK